LPIPLLWFATATLQADPQLQIVSPDSGVTVVAGSALTVIVKADTAGFQSVIVAGEGPFALSTSVTAPPYQFSYLIPLNSPEGRYILKAVGTTASGETVASAPIEMDIERADRAVRLQSEWQSLTFGEERDMPLQIWGIFPDGTKTDVTRSRRTTYTSDRPTVAVVSSEGAVSAVGVGKAKITVRYDDKAVVVPVIISRTPGQNPDPDSKAAHR
jgi:hypothetical protein